jgi:hypothetical protein
VCASNTFEIRNFEISLHRQELSKELSPDFGRDKWSHFHGFSALVKTIKVLWEYVVFYLLCRNPRIKIYCEGSQTFTFLT